MNNISHNLDIEYPTYTPLSPDVEPWLHKNFLMESFSNGAQLE